MWNVKNIADYIIISVGMLRCVSRCLSPSFSQSISLVRQLGNTSYKHVLLTVVVFLSIYLQVDDNQIATLTLNRPEKKNAFSDVTIAELGSAFKSIAEDKSIRGLIMKASGDFFCAGADLSWMKNTVEYKLHIVFELA